MTYPVYIYFLNLKQKVYKYVSISNLLNSRKLKTNKNACNTKYGYFVINWFVNCKSFKINGILGKVRPGEA